MSLVYRLIANLLKIPDPNRPYGIKLHSALLRLSPGAAIEAVALRTHQGAVEVLLRKRGSDEASYPGMWHCPGSILRPTDASTEDVFARLTKNESLGTVVTSELVDNVVHKEKRGRFLHAIYLVRVEQPGTETSWYPVDALPKPMVPQHRDFIIPKAVHRFLQKS